MTNPTNQSTFAALLDAYAKGEGGIGVHEITVEAVVAIDEFPGNPHKTYDVIRKALEAAYRRGDADATDTLREDVSPTWDDEKESDYD